MGAVSKTGLNTTLNTANLYKQRMAWATNAEKGVGGWSSMGVDSYNNLAKGLGSTANNAIHYAKQELPIAMSALQNFPKSNLKNITVAVGMGLLTPFKYLFDLGSSIGAAISKNGFSAITNFFKT